MQALKKCIVLDLDNTLWGGVVGEDGIEGIQLSLAAPGSGFVAFQQALLDHYNRGVLLAINSRNNPEDALAVIRTHPNMILKENHFAASRINWEDKAQNLKELARELNIGLDSMVFFDDDPTNRALVRAMLPEVEVPELPADPALYAQLLHSLPYFPQSAATDEDTMRGNLYVTERLRLEEQKTYASKEEFLKGLSLRLYFFEDAAPAAVRLAQMTEKTNQFNTNKIPFTEAQLLERIEDKNTKVFHARLTDKFGDYGIIALALVDIGAAEWCITTLLMSCRVFGRGVEDAFFANLVKRAKEAGAVRLTAEYIETSKNVPARDFLLRYFPAGEYDTHTVPEAPAWITTYENI